MHRRTLILRKLMGENDLTVEDVARLTRVSKGTVYNWHDSSPHTIIPEHRLELLMLKIEKFNLERMRRREKF